MKTKIFDVLRWVISPILAACLFAFCVTPAYPAKPAETKIAEQAAQPPTSTSAEVAELSKQVEELKKNELTLNAIILENERKKMDWWFGFLGLLTAIIGISGVAIPWVMGLKDMKSIKQARKAIASDKVLIEQYKREIEQQLKDAETAMYRSIEAFRMREDANTASQNGQTDKAHFLWKNLTEWTPTDANAHFNTGYWAQKSAEQNKNNGDLMSMLLDEAKYHYEKAIQIQPENLEAKNNLGMVLTEKAKIIAATKPEDARKLWKQAGDIFGHLLSIKPNMHGTAINWTSALLSEASMLMTTDHRQSDSLLNHAEMILLQHVEAEPAALYNLACLFGLRGDVTSCLKWLEKCQQRSSLPAFTHLQNDSCLDNVRCAPEFVAWLQTVCPDLPSA